MFLVILGTPAFTFNYFATTQCFNLIVQHYTLHVSKRVFLPFLAILQPGQVKAHEHMTLLFAPSFFAHSVLSNLRDGLSLVCLSLWNFRDRNIELMSWTWYNAITTDFYSGFGFMKVGKFYSILNG